MRVWEAMRKPKIVITGNEPATLVRALMRENEESIAVIVEDKLSMKYKGYLTWREVLQITSHYSILRAIDLALDHPVLYRDTNLEDAFKELEEHKVYGAPVLESSDKPSVIGVLTLSDVLKRILESEYKPIAETVAEVMTSEKSENPENYIVYSDEFANKAWSKIVYRALPGLVVLRNPSEPVPVGIITPSEFIKTSRWFFHRESEHAAKTLARIKRIMLRGAPTATPETPIEYVAKIMANNEFTVLPVIDEETGKLVGVITMYDIIRAYITGAKPGRVRPVKKPVLPIPIPPEERPTYASSERILTEVLVAKKPVEELVGVTALDIARTELPAVLVTDTLETARRAMIRYKTHYLLVVDNEGRIAGVVTKWNMLKAIGLRGPIWRRRVNDKLFIEQIMSTDIPRVKPDDSIEEIALQMFNARSEVAIVEDEEGRIYGFITKDDIIDAYARLQSGRARIENVMTPRMIGVVHPHHSLHHAVQKMITFYIDALAVYDGSKILGVLSANRLPFIAYEDSVIASKSKYIVWVRKVSKGGLRRARYVKVTPLLVLDAMVKIPELSIKSSEDVVRAIELMKKHNIDGIPVVDEEGKLIGVIAKTDIIRELARTAKLRLERGLPVTIKKRRKSESKQTSS
ncbi:MAG: CBS domain-containing protein [Thermoprotei archaeon]